MALTQVKTSGLADDAVTGAKIADDTVAEANMANDAISLTELKAGTDGQIITWDASGNPTAVGPGTDGQVLTSTGAGSPPAFEDIESDTKSFRNLIINGAMLVAQRGTSSGASSYQTVDRFALDAANEDETPTQSQVDVASGTTPYTLGFRKAFKITNGNQTSGAGTSDEISFDYRFEAQDIANSGWNYTSASSYITLSFWIKSSVAQDFKFYLKTEDGTEKGYPMATGSLSANTWTKITKTIPGHADLQFDNNAAKGLSIEFFPFIGTDRTGTITDNAWMNYNGSTRVNDNTTTWYTTNDSTLEFTGFQLEVGSSATDFEHRSYADELRRCQRYCQVTDDGGCGVGVAGGATAGHRIQMNLRTTMRAAPTVTKVGGNIYIYDGSAACQVSSTSAEYGTFDSMEWEFSSVATGDSLTAGRPLIAYINGSAGGFKMDAEL